MNSIEKRLRKLEEKVHATELPSYQEYMKDYEDKYHDVDLWEILKKEKKPFHVGVYYDLVRRDAKVEEYQQNQNKEKIE